MSSAGPSSYKTGDVIFHESPLIAIQTLSSRKNSLCCGVCCSYIGGWEVQCDLMLGSSRAACRKAIIEAESAFGCVNDRCDEVFCSISCQKLSLCNGHLLECGGVCVVSGDVEVDDQNNNNEMKFSCEKEDTRQVVEACKDFFKHSKETNELFLAARRVITTLLGSLIFPQLSSHTSTLNNVIFPRIAYENTMKLINLFKQYFKPPKLDGRCGEERNPLPDESSNCINDGVYENWLLLYTASMKMGLISPNLAPLLSIEFYQCVVNVLNVHLKSVRVQDPPLLSFLIHKLIYSDGAKLDSDCNNKVTSLCTKLFKNELGICNGLTKLAQLLTVGGDHDSSCNDIEKGANVTMCLLPACSAFSCHSCLPNAHFSSSQGSLIEADATTISGCANLFVTALPTSTQLRIQLEAIRDFTCQSIELSDNNHLELPHKLKGEDTDFTAEPILISIIPHVLEPLADRCSQLQDVMMHFFPAGDHDGEKFFCQCVRCKWEASISVHMKHHQIEYSTQNWLKEYSERVQLALANHYMQEAEKGGGIASYLEAIRLYIHIIAYQEHQLQMKVDPTDIDEKKKWIGMAYHAWGAAHLNLGCAFKMQ